MQDACQKELEKHFNTIFAALDELKRTLWNNKCCDSNLNSMSFLFIIKQILCEATSIHTSHHISGPEFAGSSAPAHL